jgi:hypothetical protein
MWWLLTITGTVARALAVMVAVLDVGVVVVVVLVVAELVRHGQGLRKGGGEGEGR